jgi:hypothetical protein
VDSEVVFADLFTLLACRVIFADEFVSTTPSNIFAKYAILKPKNGKALVRSKMIMLYVYIIIEAPVKAMPVASKTICAVVFSELDDEYISGGYDMFVLEKCLSQR